MLVPFAMLTVSRNELYDVRLRSLFRRVLRSLRSPYGAPRVVETNRLRSLLQKY